MRVTGFRDGYVYGRMKDGTRVRAELHIDESQDSLIHLEPYLHHLGGYLTIRHVRIEREKE